MEIRFPSVLFIQCERQKVFDEKATTEKKREKETTKIKIKFTLMKDRERKRKLSLSDKRDMVHAEKASAAPKRTAKSC